MNTSNLKSYAPKARRDFIEAVTTRAALYGVTNDKIEPVTAQGDVAIIGGRAFPKKAAETRKKLVDRISKEGFLQVMEAIAYTWFNRFIAIRYMELHGYLEHGYRVLSHPEGKPTPEVLEHVDALKFPGTDGEKVVELKLAGDKDEELYRLLLVGQCQSLSKSIPFMWSGVNDPSELLLPDNLLHSDSLISELVQEIPEEQWQDVEIIGWLYQFYISEKKDEVIGSVVASEDIPAATQLFTPNWIVKYLVQNSLGRQWMATYPNSPLKKEMEYYIEPAEQTPEVQANLKEITPETLNPEEITFLDPACGSGHILVEAYDLFKAIYLERGYRLRDIPRLILEKNLFGLEIDDRAAQLSCFSLMMKARADERSILIDGLELNVVSIQESNHLDKKLVIEALSGGRAVEIVPSDDLFPETLPQQNLKVVKARDGVAKTVLELIETFENAKAFGSLIRVGEDLVKKLADVEQAASELELSANLFESRVVPQTRPLIKQAKLLGEKYDCVVANPPYMGRKYFNSTLKKYINERLPLGKTDLYAAFMDCARNYVRPGKYLGLITMQSWMFLSSSEDLRRTYLENVSLCSMLHLGPNAFEEISGEVVQATAFSAQLVNDTEFTAAFFRLVDCEFDEKRKYTVGAIQNPSCSWFFEIQQSKFLDIPGTPIAYWVSDRVRQIFQEGTPFGDIADPKQGMTTSDNSRFLRRWYEISHLKIGLRCVDLVSARDSKRKWFPYNKGGDFRKWYGNFEYVVNYLNDGEELKSFHEELNKTNPGGRLKNQKYYFRPSITWTFVSSGNFGVRQSEGGFIFDVGGSSAFPPEKRLDELTAFLCSKIAFFFLKALNPTLNFQVENVAALPLLEEGLSKISSDVGAIARKAIFISREDWDLSETSIDFLRTPLLQGSNAVSLASAYRRHVEQCRERKIALRQLELRNNQLLSSVYLLEDEVPSEIRTEDLTLYEPTQERETDNLVSYAIGCMMGRYSLDEPGLIYAHIGNIDFDLRRYNTFPADEDGIVPVTDFAWFEDDATNRFEEFISVSWAKKHLEENLRFVAENLKPKRDEVPRETIRRYLATSFYKNHLQMYKKRPIYWLFSSGKQRAFQCLVYLHRYNEGTLARMRTEYVIPLQGKFNTRIDQLEDDIAVATSTAHRKQLESEQQTLKKQREELKTFDEKLRHYADMRISLDLDDGVKVNYGKFGDLLAEVKAITGKKAA